MSSRLNAMEYYESDCGVGGSPRASAVESGFGGRSRREVCREAGDSSRRRRGRLSRWRGPMYPAPELSTGATARFHPNSHLSAVQCSRSRSSQMADDEYEDLYGDLYPGEAEYGNNASAAPATNSVSSTAPLTEAPPLPATTTSAIPSLASPAPATSAIVNLADQPQQHTNQNQGGDRGMSNPPMHFAPNFAAQRQQTGQTGGVRPSDMPEEG